MCWSSTWEFTFPKLPDEKHWSRLLLRSRNFILRHRAIRGIYTAASIDVRCDVVENGVFTSSRSSVAPWMHWIRVRVSASWYVVLETFKIARQKKKTRRRQNMTENSRVVSSTFDLSPLCWTVLNATIDATCFSKSPVTEETLNWFPESWNAFRQMCERTAVVPNQRKQAFRGYVACTSRSPVHVK